MSDRRERQALHRLCDSVDGANWRPTLFVDELTLSRYACCVCHVVPSITVVLPCSHALCEQCVMGCVDENGGSVCPLDAEPFCEDECQRSQLPPRKKQHLKAHCWNEADGCHFVGTPEAVLSHYDGECAFHTVQCRRCERRILRTVIAAHYVAGTSAMQSVASRLLFNVEWKVPRRTPARWSLNN
ncbi:TNF receptor-associated factor 5-like [Rhipicephalus sanguineus]|uniref:TNF receptor-associated factor 5-like n=1 Tax=Rhipicephalus sanguineus TaxID=34632 RepID=UPI0020C3A93C|nr:TNF receptor-associated factor 5-like [Rhipicephalus sanguineus]